MDDNIIAKEKESLDFWERIEKIIKKRESLIFLLLIIGALVFIPLKILSYGWTPPDDAKRHVAFSTIDSKWSDIIVMDEKFDTDHNAGWHQILKFIHKYCGYDKQDLMFFSVVGLFLLLNICGIISVPSPVSWCLALLLILNLDDKIYYRMISGRPFIVSCAATLILLRLWGIKTLDDEKRVIFQKEWIKYLITIVVLSLSIWIHGSWYLFLLIPISFFIAGKTKDSLILTACVLISTVIGSLLTGRFTDFLYFHFFATFSIFTESTYNWLLVPEFAAGVQNVVCIIGVSIVILFCIKKCDYKLKNIANDPIFIMVLLCWMGSILVIRFWLDWGIIALLLWLSYRLQELINSSYSLNNPRIRYSLSFFIIVCFILCFINDKEGRYTKSVMMQPIDFYNESTIQLLKGWEPQDGGIIYSNTMYCFYEHFYEYPTAKWKYVLGFEPAIMKQDDKQTLRNIGYSKLEYDYAAWVKKMTEKDRLITFSKLNSFPQLEWIKGNRTWWIGRLKERK